MLENIDYLIPDDPAKIMELMMTLEGRRSPHALFSHMRDIAPVYRDPNSGMIFLHRWADCDQVLRSPRFGGQNGRLQSHPSYPSSDALQLIAGNLAFKDPPDHTRLRNFAQRAFSRPVIEGLRGYLLDLTQQVLDRLEPLDEIDVVNDFAIQIPPAVICHMLGVPTEDRPLFESWVADQFRLLTPTPTTPEVLAEVDGTTRQLVAYMSALIDERRAAPRDDLISALIAARGTDGDQMTQHELVAMATMLLGGGSDTTRFVIAMGIRGLIRDPEQAELLREDPTLDAKAFEEFARLYGPVVTANSRKSYDDVEIGGVMIKAGEWVVPQILAANTDPATFRDPMRLDIRRHPNPHLAFGGGAHACIGMMMARMIGPVAIGSFTRRYPRLTLVDEHLDINPQLFALRGLNSLRVRKV